MSFLEVKDIDVQYGYATVLHEVSLDVDRGEFVFVIGRNGAGKTTLLKSINGLKGISNGVIKYDGKDITKKPAEILAKNEGIRFVAQDKKVFDDLTVRENLEMAAFAVKEPMEKTLERTMSIYPEMEQFLDMPAGKLSGGQKEILLIARALVGNPRLMLIDEPTEGLASIVIKEIQRLLEHMKGELTAIVVEQNLNLVANLADRIYAMKEGRIVHEQKNLGEDVDKTVEELEKYL